MLIIGNLSLLFFGYFGLFESGDPIIGLSIFILIGFFILHGLCFRKRYTPLLIGLLKNKSFKSITIKTGER